MNDFLLGLFTCVDELRPVYAFPNLSNGVVYATDAHAIISIPEDELCLKYNTNDEYPNAQRMFDGLYGKKLESIWVDTSDLAKELAKARIEVDKDSIKCKECNGNGTVTFEYEDRKGKEHYIHGDCPICDGEGATDSDSKFARIKLDMVNKEDGTPVGIYVGGLYFHPFQLYRLFMVASLNRVDGFKIYYDPNKYGMVLSVFGNIKVIVMLMRRD